MEMEGSVRSGGVIKKKSSSGCLIIKRKDDSKKTGGGLGGLSNSEKEKKRPRVVESVSGSSDEDESLEFMRRKVNDKRLRNGLMGCKRNEIDHIDYHRGNVEVEINVDRKRNRLGLFDFDEYDEFDGKKMRNNYVQHGSYFDGSSSGRSKGVEYSGSRNKGIDLEDDEAHMPISSLKLKYQEKASEAIRLQGKNGVLKVMVNKKKKNDLTSQHLNIDPVEVDERKSFRSKDVSKRGSFVDKQEEVKLEKIKPMLSKGKRIRESEIDSSDKALKLTPEGLQSSSSKKVVEKKVERSPSPEDVTPVKVKAVKEDELKRGGSTEKQMLREKIRGILIDAGWTIDYRPRRNRDYLDAVYINPSGTAYWSIVKAYDAFKKQLGEGNDKSKSDHSSPSFAPLSDNLLHKLTRRTKKKIEEETKRKRKEAGLTKSAKKSSVREASKSSDGDQNEDDSSDDLPKMKSRKVRAEKTSVTSPFDTLHGRTSKVIGRRTLLVRGSDKAEALESDGYVPFSGKRTILGWLIDSGTAQLSEKLQYMNRKRTKAMLEGWITRDGIHCGCCSKILPVLKFELHAGSKLHQPFQNIFLESGASLLQCQIDAWNKQDESLRRDFHVVGVDGDDPDDDTCGICGDGGDLICCDSCPSTFHQICSGIQILPSGDWHCPNCICKFCGDASRKVAGENDSIVDELIECSFCEKKYHKTCNEEVYAPHMISNGTSFCGPKCQELYDHLQKILGVKHELEAGFSWSLIQRTDVSDTSLRGYHQRVECNSMLAVALSVMDECFLPIIDRRSGFNMIHNVVYNCGSNFNRLNYRGFYTAILERGDELVSAACIRIRGTHLAEMPFIGTRGIYRRQGMCRRLLSAIELELTSLKVGNLIIPAISEHMNTWTTAFGFHQLGDVLKKEIKSMNMLVFPGTDMLQKQLLKQEISDAIGMKVSDSKKQPDSPDKFTGLDRQLTDDSGCPPPPVPSNNNEAANVCKIEDASGETSDKAKGTEIDNSSALEGAEFVNLQGNIGSPVKVSEDIAPQKIANNSSFESSSVPVCEISAKSATCKVNGKHVASFPAPVFKEESLVQLKPDMNQPTEPLMENELHSSVEVSVNDCTEISKGNQNPDPVTTFADTEESIPLNGAEVDVISLPAQVLKEESLVQLKPDMNQLIESLKANELHSSIEVSANACVKTTNENQNPDPAATFADTEENIPSRGAEVDIAPQIIVNNGSFESSSGSVYEISAENYTCKVNGEFVASLPAPVLEESSSVQLKPDMNQLTEPLMENELPSSVGVCANDFIKTTKEDQNPNPIATFADSEESIPLSGAEVDIAPQIIVNNGLFEPLSGSVNETSTRSMSSLATPDAKEESLVRLKPDKNPLTEHLIEAKVHSSIEVSSDNHIETVNENQNPELISTLHDSGERIPLSSVETDHNTPTQIKNELVVSGVVRESADLFETKKPDGEKEKC